MGQLLCIFFMVLGVIHWYKSLLAYRMMQTMLNLGYRTTAKIIDIILEEKLIHDQVSFIEWPVYEYTDKYNRTHQIQPSTTVNGLTTYEIGDRVDIIYMLNEPEKEILILTQTGQWQGAVGFLLVGTFSFVVGLMVFIHNGYHERLLG